MASLHSSVPSHIPRVGHELPGHPGITICVYGKKEAGNAQEEREQGYFVARQGRPLARADLFDDEKVAVQVFLAQNYPQHARI